MENRPRSVRVDELLVARGLCESRSRAKQLILAGEVFSGEERIERPGRRLPADAPLRVAHPLPYVSRGGLKLAHALAAFDLCVRGRVALDVGASTGGFTDCLLQHGARRVYALDVGREQLHSRLRADPRVVVMEGVDIRTVPPAAIPEPIDLATVDVSFISLVRVFAPLSALLQPAATVVALVKPQFEAGRDRIGKGGVVRDPRVHAAVLEAVLNAAARCELAARGLITSPILGGDGNAEFLLALARGPAAPAA
ncbi:MAG TPA: TlyA family RNA methyltransferase, partial [Limnochordia bacterium]